MTLIDRRKDVKMLKLMHDPQDTGFTLQCFELSKGI